MNIEYFVDQLRVVAALEDSPATERTLDAFKSVAREDFAGKGPWKLHSARAGVSLPPRSTPDDDPKWLYHCVLIVLDEEKGINIGDPGLWAGLLSRADIRPGSRILQVGAGVGYYTAILSKLAGPSGHVVAYEVEKELAESAARNVAGYGNVEVRLGNAAVDLTGSAKFDLVVSFAGVTHIPSIWKDRLAPDARLLLPLTGEDWWGAMILAEQSDDSFDAVTLGRCGFYPCLGARREDLAAQVSELFSPPGRFLDWNLRIVGQGDDLRWEPKAA
ncbi:MAG: methyltransferase domain-containing protein [Pseudomonadota bacterium]